MERKHWFRARFFQQYRLFFRHHAYSQVIVHVWVNDAETRRAYGSGQDAYRVFGAVAAYLWEVHQEATRRGYRFDASRIAATTWSDSIQETTGQLLYEWKCFLGKVSVRSPDHHAPLIQTAIPTPHPLFTLVAGEVREWERIVPNRSDPQ